MKDPQNPDRPPTDQTLAVRAHFPRHRSAALEYRRLMSIMEDAIWTEFTKWEAESQGSVPRKPTPPR